MINIQTSKETVKLKKLHTVKTVKRHKMQKVAELAQLTLMDKIHQKANWVKWFKPTNKRRSETQQNWTN